MNRQTNRNKERERKQEQRKKQNKKDRTRKRNDKKTDNRKRESEIEGHRDRCNRAVNPNLLHLKSPCHFLWTFLVPFT